MENCYNCKHMVATQPDIVCHITCSKTDRDFTYGREDDTACKLFEED